VSEGRGNRELTKVIVEPDESFESALKRFKKQCEKAGLLSELKKRQHYEKPSARRKRKALAARKKAKRRERTSD
jgi:small subunit ribosomal protein S21